MHDQGLPAARLTCAAYIDGNKRWNSSFWKDSIIVASTCRRSVQFGGCYVTWVRMANCFYVIARMLHLYKFTISHRWNGAWKTSRFACAHTRSHYWLVESTLFGDHVCLRLHWEFSLRPPAGRQMTILPMPISQQPLIRSSPNFQQLLLMSNKGKLVNFNSFAHG